MAAWVSDISLRLQSLQHLITKGSLSLLNQKLGHDLVKVKTFEIVLYLNIQGAQWPRWTTEAPVVLFTALLFLSQHPSSLSLSFIISQASTGQFQNCCCGIAAQSLLGSNEAAIGCYYLFHILGEFWGVSSLRRGPMPEACVFLSRKNFSGLPTQLRVMMLLKIISVS